MPAVNPHNRAGDFPTSVATYYMSCDAPGTSPSTYTPAEIDSLMANQVATLRALEVLDNDFAYSCGSEPVGASVRATLVGNMKAVTTAANNTLAQLAEYEKCFYSAAELKKSDVLNRSYLPLRRVLEKVKAWAAARGGARGAWRPIGVPSRSHSGAEVRKLMAL